MNPQPHRLTDIKRLLEIFIAIIDQIYKKELVRLNWRDLMLNRGIQSPEQKNGINRRGLLFNYHKRFVALRQAVVLHALASQSMERFKQERIKVADEIKDLDLELSNRVRYFVVSSSVEFEWLKPIAEMLDSNLEFGVSYIRVHFKEIMQKLTRFSDRKTEYQLKRLIVELSGEEISQLSKCLADLDIWASYIISQKPDFFVSRLLLYLKGGNINGVEYLGLASHFKDAELAAKMMKIPQIRSIWTYQQQLTFLNDALYYAGEAIKSADGFYKKGNFLYRINGDRSVDYRVNNSQGRWKSAPLNANFVSRENGFQRIEAQEDSEQWSLFIGNERNNYKDGFIYNLRNGKKYIAMVREKFGNHVFSEFLEKTEHEFHQSPMDWYKKLLEFSRGFTALINIHIEESRRELTVLFHERKNTLQQARRGAANKLRDLLKARVIELENSAATVKIKFGKMLRKHSKKVNSEWNKIKNRYGTIEEGVLLKVWLFKRKAEKFLERMDRRKIYIKYRTTLKENIKTKFFFEKALRRLFSSQNDDTIFEKLEIPIIYSLYKSYRQSVEMDEYADEIEYVEDSDIQELKSLIGIANKILIPSLDKLEIEINIIVNQYFLQGTQQYIRSKSADSKNERLAA